jgi:hypothetical protein
MIKRDILILKDLRVENPNTKNRLKGTNFTIRTELLNFTAYVRGGWKDVDITPNPVIDLGIC